LFEGSYLDSRMIEELVSLGAVGEIGGRFFAADGAVGDTDLQHRTVSGPLEGVRRGPTAVPLTGGAGQHRAALRALPGGFARYLVCDFDCARWLLTHAKEEV